MTKEEMQERLIDFAVRASDKKKSKINHKS